jgi:hypothetical protein
MVIVARSNFGNPIFREIFIMACWVIWTARNAIIFDNEHVELNTRLFKKELGHVCTKAKPAIQSSLRNWRDSYLLYYTVFFLLGMMPCNFNPVIIILLFNEKEKIGRGLPCCFGQKKV